MKIVYNLDLNNEVTVETYKDQSIILNIENGEVHICIDENAKLNDLKIVFKGLPVQYAEDGVINPYYPATRVNAYKIATYLANRILISTTLDPINCNDILTRNIEATPETDDEQEAWAKYKKRMFTDLSVSYSIIGAINIDDIFQKYSYSSAYSHFADGIRITNIISSFEQYYKIIETFFSGTAAAFDRAVSSHAVQFNPEITEAYVRNLRQLRNRCVHAQAHHGHITSDDLDLSEIVSRESENLKKLAKVLIDNPII